MGFAESKTELERQMAAAAAVHGGTVKERKDRRLYAAEYRVTFPGIRGYTTVHLEDDGHAHSAYVVKEHRTSKAVVHTVLMTKPEYIAAFFKGVVEGRFK